MMMQKKKQHTRASDGRAIGFTDVPEKAMRAAPYDLPPSTDGMAMVCMIDEPIGDVRSDLSRIIGIFRKDSSVRLSCDPTLKLIHCLQANQQQSPYSVIR